MLIGILSDTHDEHFRTRIAVEKLGELGAEALIHCGDVTTIGILETLSALPTHFVFGNCDRVAELRRGADEFGLTCLGDGGIVEFQGKRLAVTHSHLNSEVQRLLNEEPDYLFSGHSHIANVWREGNTRRINPGALHRAGTYTVGLLNLESDEFEFIEIPRLLH